MIGPTDWQCAVVCVNGRGLIERHPGSLDTAPTYLAVQGRALLTTRKED